MSVEELSGQFVDVTWVNRKKGTFFTTAVPVETAQGIFSNAEQEKGNVSLRITTPQGEVFEADDALVDLALDPVLTTYCPN